MKYDKIDEVIGQKLFEARVVKRISQEEMADKISKLLIENGEKGIARQTYSLYERGSHSMSNHTFSAACKVLGLDDVEVFNAALEEAKL